VYVAADRIGALKEKHAALERALDEDKPSSQPGRDYDLKR
jgi:hypothetical protein